MIIKVLACDFCRKPIEQGIMCEDGDFCSKICEAKHILKDEPDHWKDMVFALHSGKKIEAIKAYRAAVNFECGLKEAKDYVDKITGTLSNWQIEGLLADAKTAHLMLNRVEKSLNEQLKG